MRSGLQSNDSSLPVPPPPCSFPPNKTTNNKNKHNRQTADNAKREAPKWQGCNKWCRAIKRPDFLVSIEMISSSLPTCPKALDLKAGRLVQWDLYKKKNKQAKGKPKGSKGRLWASELKKLGSHKMRMFPWFQKGNPRCF